MSETTPPTNSSSAPQSPCAPGTPARRLASALIPGLILFVAALVYNRGLDSYQSYHVDEGEWIFAGTLYSDLFFFHRDFANPLWADQLGTWGSLNPQAGKYLIGLSTNLFAGLAPLDSPPQALLDKAKKEGQPAGQAWQAMAMRKLGYYRYSFDKDAAWNRANGRIPPARLLAAGRRGVVLCGLLAGACIFLIARLLWGERAGWFAMALFLANPMIFAYSRRAMTDIPCLAFVLLGLYGLLAALCFGAQASCLPSASLRADKGSLLKRIGWPLLAGLGWGLAVSTKLSALAPYGAALGVAFAWAAWQIRMLLRLPQPRRSSFALVAILPVAMLALPAALFILTNPFLYHGAFSPWLDQPTKFHFMLQLGRMIAMYQPQAAAVTLADKLAFAATFLGRDASFTKTLIHLPLDAMLFPLAAALMPWDLWRRLRQSSPAAAPLAALLIVSLGSWVTTIAWLPLAWDRLLLPLLPFFVLALAYGLDSLTACLFCNKP